jgi:hypothetical protein
MGFIIFVSSLPDKFLQTPRLLAAWESLFISKVPACKQAGLSPQHLVSTRWMSVITPKIIAPQPAIQMLYERTVRSVDTAVREKIASSSATMLRIADHPAGHAGNAMKPRTLMEPSDNAIQPSGRKTAARLGGFCGGRGLW